nr:E3 ubiquitin-protein ligase PDZRN3-B-like [Oncorhynchus nerka]
MDNGLCMENDDSNFDHRDVGVCKKGCRLLLQTDIAQGDHCCLDALRMLNDALQERSVTLEHEARMQRLRWVRREQSLLAQVSSLQSEAQLTALRYRRKLHQYMLNTNNIAKQVIGYYKSDSGASGVCLSQLSEQSPTDALDELQDQEEHGLVPEVSHCNILTLPMMTSSVILPEWRTGLFQSTSFTPCD